MWTGFLVQNHLFLSVLCSFKMDVGSGVGEGIGVGTSRFSLVSIRSLISPLYKFAQAAITKYSQTSEILCIQFQTTAMKQILQ